MITPYRLVVLLVLLCPSSAATLAAEKFDLPPGAESEAVRQLDAILDRIRGEIRESNDVQKLYGVERSKSNGDSSDVTNISVVPSYDDSVGDSVYEASSSFSDKDLACLAPLKGITRLAICRSKITDAGLRHLASLNRLEYLDLSENAITDDGLKSLANLTALKQLSLRKTIITGSGLAHLARLKELRDLNLDDSPVDGQGISSLPNLPLLEKLSAARTRIDDFGIAAFRRTPNLTSLDLRNSAVDDAGLIHLRGLTQLRALRLSGAPVRGPGFLHLGSLTQLAQLECRPIYSKELASVLAQWKKLQALDLEMPDPTSMPQSERRIELYEMESLAHLRLHCPHGAESIEVRDMPGLRNVWVEPSAWIGSGIGKPRGQIGQIRIRGVKTLDNLFIPMPERLALSDLASIDNLRLDGVLKTAALRELGKLEFREVGLNASPDSEPSALSVFAPAFRANRRGKPRLWLTLDAVNADWLDALRELTPSPDEIRIRTRTVDCRESLDLAKLDGLRSFWITATDPVTLPRFTVVGPPKTLRDLSLNGFQIEELHCKGWYPTSLGVQSASRIIVSDLAEETRVTIPVRDNLREFEIHNAPKLITLYGPSTTSRIQSLAVYNAPKLQTMMIRYSPMLTSVQLNGSFPDLRYVEVGSAGLDDAFLTQLKDAPSLKTLNIAGCKNLSDEAISSFRKAHSGVEVRGK